MLSVTGLTPHGYALTVTLFSVAYAIFEVPSNWVMKHYIRPSMWLGILLFAWGGLTIGFAGVKNTSTIIALRFLIGVFEAGFFPGALQITLDAIFSADCQYRYRLLHHNLVSLE